MRVLFLDFDGVLNSRAFVEASGWEPPLGAHDDARILDPRAVDLVESVLATTGACVVVTSSWRSTHGLDTLRALLRRRGLTRAVIGVTRALPGRDRDAEIAHWLREHPDVEGFAIVDDDETAGASHPARFVCTSYEEGLTEAHARRLIEILTR